MKGFKEFLGEEDGVAIIEIVLILVILIGLIVVFNTKIKSLNTKILKKIGLFYATKAERTSWVAEKIQKEFGIC